jgi:hypothetical protein
VCANPAVEEYESTLTYVIGRSGSPTMILVVPDRCVMESRPFC